MIQYKVHAHQKPINGNPVSRDLLRYLEMSVKEVKCRKDCRCVECRRIIGKGEIALKTVQSLRDSFYYNAYCSECYTVLKN